MLQPDAEMSMDDRLAPLKHEIDRIMSAGPIGRWSNPPSTFPFQSGSADFKPDGSGVIVRWSGMSGKSTQPFSWSMQAPGRLVMQFGDEVIEDDLPGDSAMGETPDPAPEGSDDASARPVALDIEIKVEETEFGPWPVMISKGAGGPLHDKDLFGPLPFALARSEPPLVLPRPQQRPAERRAPSRLSRLRRLVRGFRVTR